VFDNISAREKYQFVLIKKRKKRPPNKLVSFHAKNHKISKNWEGKILIKWEEKIVGRFVDGGRGVFPRKLSSVI